MADSYIVASIEYASQVVRAQASPEGIGASIEFLLTQGVLGIACIALGWLYLNERRRSDDIQTKCDAIQERRLEEAKMVGGVIANSTVAMNDLTKAVLAKYIITPVKEQ